MATTAAQRLPLGGVLTPHMERSIRLGSIGSAVVIAISAMVLSYAGLHDLAIDAEIHPRFALLVPIMVDGLQFVGSLGVVYSTLSGLRSWYPWVLMLMGVSVSAWGNWQAAPDQLTAKLLHAAAPIILALVLEELLRVMRHKVHLHAEREAEAAAEDEAAAEAGKTFVSAHTGSSVAEVAVVASESSDADGRHVARDEKATDLTAPTGTDPAVAAVVAVVASDSRIVEPSEIGAAPSVPVVAVESALDAPEPMIEVATAASPQVAPTPVATQPDVNPVASPVALAAASPAPATAPTTAPTTAAAASTAAEPTGSPQESRVAQVQTEDSSNTLPPYPADATFKEQVRAMLTQDPTLGPATIAKAMGKDPSNTRKIVKKVLTEMAEQEIAERTPAAGAPRNAETPTTPAVTSTQTAPAQAPVPQVASVTQPATQVAVAPAPRLDRVDLTGADPFGTASPAAIPVGASR